ncbi:MAG: PAS domain S-box protein [Elusimicrobia bacterium]|nr:PAS domain S-box protein [Elusimicrobiota bacterium]
MSGEREKSILPEAVTRIGVWAESARGGTLLAVVFSACYGLLVWSQYRDADRYWTALLGQGVRERVAVLGGWVNWWTEEVSEFAGSPEARAALAEPQAGGAARRLFGRRLRQARDLHGFQSLCLTDARGRLLADASAAPEACPTSSAEVRVLHQAEAASVLVRGRSPRDTRIGLSSPVEYAPGQAGHLTGWISAEQAVLAHIVRGWVEAKTGESILACRGPGGNTAILISPLRFSGDDAFLERDLRDARPLSAALEGKEQAGWQTDYHGQRVLAAFAPIPGTGLVLGRKVDRSEVLAGFLDKAVLEGLVLLLSLAGLLLLHQSAASRLRLTALVALKAGEERFQRLVDEAPTAMGLCRAGRMVYANKAMLALLGWREASEYVGRSRLEDVAPECREQTARRLCVSEWGLPLQGAYEVTLLRRDRSRVEVSAKEAALGDDEGGAVVIILEDLTQRNRALKELKDMAMEWQRTFDGVEDGVCLLDADMHVARCNRALAGIVGRSPEELLGLPCWKVFHPEAKSLAGCPARAACSGEAKKHLPIVLGSRRYEVTFDPIKGGSGEFLGGVHMLRDVDERRRMEEGIRESEGRLQAIARSVQDAIIMMDEEGRACFWNRAAEETFGYSASEIQGKELKEVLGGTEFDEMRRKAFERWKKTGERGSVGMLLELQGRRKDGADFPLELSLASIQLDGELRAVAVVRDVSVRKAAEAERDRTGQRLSRLTEVLLARGQDPGRNIERLTTLAGETFGADCALYCRIEGGCIRVLGGWRTPPGLKLEDRAQGHVCEGVVSSMEEGAVFIPDLAATPFAKTDPNVSAYGLRCYFGHVVKKGEERVGSICTVFSRPFEPSEEDRRLMGIFAAALGMEESHQELNARFLHSQKMEAVGRLAGGIAHDFNNILTAIRGYAEFLMSGFGPGDARLADAREIVTASDRARDLTRQMLAFSRRQVLRPSVVDLGSVVRGVAKMLGRIVGEDVRLEVACGDGLPKVRVDTPQFEQVIVNLAVNARDAMPAGGVLRITTSFEGGRVVMRVEDSGCGIAPDVLARVFEPFFTTKEKGRGTGLGLSTVYGIVKQSDGDIAAESLPGKGAVFTISLPPAGGAGVEEAGERVVPDEEDLDTAGSETVLVAEDEEKLRALAGRVLAAKGYEVLSAGSGEEALRLLAQRQGAVHLLLTDVVMPGMNGKELAERAVSLRPGLKVLFVSGYPDEVLGLKGILEDGVRFISKPFSKETLCQKVREILDSAPEHGGGRGGALGGIGKKTGDRVSS